MDNKCYHYSGTAKGAKRGQMLEAETEAETSTLRPRPNNEIRNYIIHCKNHIDVAKITLSLL